MVLTPKNQRQPQWREPAYWKSTEQRGMSPRTEGFSENGYIMPGTCPAPMYSDPNGRNLISMPGSVAGMTAKSNMDAQWADASIWWRMAVIIRMRRLDLIEIMHGFDPKDCNKFEQTVFQRALADCFGNQWGELGMTAAEYEEITAPYLTGPPSAPGQPPPMIGYRRFACDLMKIAEEQISDQDTKIAMAMRGKATVTPLNQKVAPRR